MEDNPFKPNLSDDEVCLWIFQQTYSKRNNVVSQLEELRRLVDRYGYYSEREDWEWDKEYSKTMESLEEFHKSLKRTNDAVQWMRNNKITKTTKTI